MVGSADLSEIMSGRWHTLLGREPSLEMMSGRVWDLWVTYLAG